MTRIQTTHVGSLPRSQEVTDLLFAKELGKAFDQQQFDETMTAHVEMLVRRQKEAGIDVVSDGETSKISYATYVKDRYSGFSGDSPRNAPADLKQFPGFLQRLADSGGTPTYARPMCTGEIKPLDNGDLDKDIANLKAAMAGNNITRGFMNAASPGVISLFLQNDYYPSRQDYLEALSEVMKAEYKAIIDAGLDLQLDCPDLALSRHMLFSEMSDDEFVEIADSHVAALNYALEGLPKAKIRVHICWGNYEGPHVCDISMDKVFPVLMNTHAGYILFETSNPRHAHEWTVFKDRASEVPEDKILIPGVLDSTTNFVEHPDVVAQRLERFTSVFGPERVMAGTDCGFGTFAGFGAVDPEIAWAKLGVLRQGADRSL
jgi:5-methyltetrahydropteroyltriglutamate--homocysteine methyltransferase